MQLMNQEPNAVVTEFVPRWYQDRLIQKVFKEGIRNCLLVWSRRSGKDVIAWNIAIWFCLMKKCIVFYIFPTQGAAREGIWSGQTIDGRNFLDFIPPHLIAKKNEARMEVTFTNGSRLCLKGSTNFDTLRGSNPYVCIFSEYAYQDERVYKLFLRPVMAANQGVCIFISTPFGKNHFFELYEIAKNTPETWYTELLTAEDTGHVDMNEVRRDVQLGFISEDQMLQEFYCSFDRGVQGSIFGKLLHKLKLEDRLGFVPYEEGHLVHTAWDLGWDDECAIVMFQVIGQMVRIIDCYSNRLKPLEHYAQVLRDKGYLYGKHFLPHDAEQHSLNDGNTRTQKLYDLGFNCEVLPRKFIADRLEDGRCIFARLWIDEQRCEPLLKSLENYRREWDDRLQKYKDNPIHDNWSHFADAFTYMAAAVPLASPGMTQKDADDYRARALAKQHNTWR